MQTDGPSEWGVLENGPGLAAPKGLVSVYRLFHVGVTHGPGCGHGHLQSRVGHPCCLLCLLDFQYPPTSGSTLWTSLSETALVGPSPAQDIRRTQMPPTGAGLKAP